MTTALLHRGARFGDLRLTGYVGSGGFSDVYEAFDKSGGRLAIKVLRLSGLDSEGQQKRIEREREALSRIGSRGVAKLLHSDLQCETPWIASEFVDGPTLEEIVEERGPLSRDEGLSLVRRLAEILDELHREGIAHRDLSPNNIIIGPDGPVIIDFGSARIDLEGSATGSLLLAGTSGFVPPEALRGEPVGRAGDLYSLAKVAQFATGLARDRLPQTLNDCLSKDTGLRPSAAAIAIALSDFQLSVARYTKREVKRLKRRFGPLTVLFSMVAASVIGVSIGVLFHEDQPPKLSFSESQRKIFLEGEAELPTVVVGSPYLNEIQLPVGLHLSRVNPAGMSDPVAQSPFNHLMTLEYFELTSTDLPDSLSLSVEVMDPFLMPPNELDWKKLKGTPEELRPFFAQFEKDKALLLADPILTCSLSVPDIAEVIPDKKLLVLYAENECFDYSIHLGLAISLNDLIVVRVAGVVPKEYSSHIPGILGASDRTRKFSGSPTRIFEGQSRNILADLGFGEDFSTFMKSQENLFTAVRSFIYLDPNDALVVSPLSPILDGGTNFELTNWAFPLGASVSGVEARNGIATSMGALHAGSIQKTFVIPNRSASPIIVGLEVGWTEDSSIPVVETVLFRGALESLKRDVNSEIEQLFLTGEFTRNFPILLNSSVYFDNNPYTSSNTLVDLGEFSVPTSPRLPVSTVSIDGKPLAVHMNQYGISEIGFPLESYPAILIVEGQVASSTSDAQADEFFERFPLCRTDGRFSSRFGIRRIDAQVLSGCTSRDLYGRLPSAQDNLVRVFPIIRLQVWEDQPDGFEKELLRIIFVPEFIDDIDYFAELVSSLSDQLGALASVDQPIASPVVAGFP